MPSSVQLSLGPLQVKRVAASPVEDVNAVDTGELPLEIARELAGQIVAATVEGDPLKAVGDKGQVSRWKTGENPNLARLIASEARRKRMAKALIESCEGLELREEWRVVERKIG